MIQKKLILLWIILLFMGCNPSTPVVEYSVIPEPQAIVYANGDLSLGHTPSIAFNHSLASEAAMLSHWLTEDFQMQPLLKEGGSKGAIVLALDKTLMPEQPEAYVLDVSRKRITIKAATSVGILHGIQTLRQLVREEEGKYLVQTGTITDSPYYSWRAFMLDEGRYFKGKVVVFDLLDEMARLKLNTFHWHLTNDQGWRIEIKKYPRLTEVGAYRDSSEIHHFHSNVYDGKPHGGFYTQEEIKEVVAYAAERGITVVPEISMPGHASAAIAAYPWLGASGKEIKVPGQFGVHYNVFHVADPKVMQFLEDVIDEVIALFPAPVFHIGGDEVKYDEWKASPVIKKYMKEQGLKTPAELQVFFTNKISHLLATKNRRMMGWNEITGQQLHEYQSDEDTQGEQKLNPEAIVHFWKGDPKLIKQTLEQGYNVVNSYHIFTYLDYSYKSIPLEKAYHFNPTPEGLTSQQQKQVLGLGCQMWGEFIPTVESMQEKVYPRIAAYAECGWTLPEKKDYNRFVNALYSFLPVWDKKGIIYGPVQEQ